MVAQFVGARVQVLLLEHVEHGQRGFAGDRIAGKCSAQPAGAGRVHDFGATGDRRQRQSSTDRLRRDDDVGLDAVAFAGKERAGAAEPALHFVGDEQHAMLVADVDQDAEIIQRRSDEAAFAQAPARQLPQPRPPAATTRLNVSSR